MEKTVLIKLSGESLSGSIGYGFDFDYINKICLKVKKIYDKGIRIGIVCGGGNFLRGRDTKEMNRERADYIGMFATIMNSIALKDTFLKLDVPVYIQSGLSVAIIDDIDSKKAIEELDNGKIVIFAGGTGKPYFSTDTGAALRAHDINANQVIKLTNVDGVYNKDPNKYDDAKLYDTISYDEVISKKLQVMDLSAIEICRDNNIEIIVANIDMDNVLDKIINDDDIGTKVY